MRLITAGDVLRLTGLSAHQLREWTMRRRLVRPDAEPHGPGSRARFAWQTVLLLRLAVVLRENFYIELQVHRDFLSGLRERLAGVSFPALRGCALVIQPGTAFDVLPLGDARARSGDMLIVELDPHLEVLSTEFGLVGPTRQLTLFPAVAVR